MMPGDSKAVRTCDECGATIAAEEFRNQRAARFKGRIYCPDCTQDLKSKLAAVQHAESSAGSAPDITDVPVVLVDDDLPQVVAGPSDQIHGFSGALERQAAEREYKRPLLKGVRSATRCHTFHCKLTDGSFHHLNEQINDWVDEREDVEIKYALSNIGTIEGKHSDPHLIITIFY